MRGFNDLSELAPEAVEHLLDTAKRLEKHPEPRALEGKVLALLFLSPSLRTLTSFQAGMMRLGGGSFVASPQSGIHGLETRSGVTMDGVAGQNVVVDIMRNGTPMQIVMPRGPVGISGGRRSR